MLKFVNSDVHVEYSGNQIWKREKYVRNYNYYTVSRLEGMGSTQLNSEIDLVKTVL